MSRTKSIPTGYRCILPPAPPPPPPRTPGPAVFPAGASGAWRGPALSRGGAGTGRAPVVARAAAPPLKLDKEPDETLPAGQRVYLPPPPPPPPPPHPGTRRHSGDNGVAP